MTPYVLVVAKWRDDVFAGLFFDGLPGDLRQHIRGMAGQGHSKPSVYYCSTRTVRSS